MGQGEGLGGQEASRPRAARRGKLFPRGNRLVDSIDLRVPVVFSRCIGADEAASLLAEVRSQKGGVTRIPLDKRVKV